MLSRMARAESGCSIIRLSASSSMVSTRPDVEQAMAKRSNKL
ncbi:hypothetical protein [Muribaculum intestinale]|nr:hypothetical protein [Muribaculum intestinale]